MKILSVALIIVGILALAYQGITYTTHKKVIDIGPIQATKEEHNTIPIPPVLWSAGANRRSGDSGVGSPDSVRTQAFPGHQWLLRRQF